MLGLPAAAGRPCLLASRLSSVAACRRRLAVARPAAWRPRRRLTRAAAHASSVVVVGGGAAGLTAATFAAAAAASSSSLRPSVTVLERNAVCGRKILVSGGGRCNVLPSMPVDAASDFWPAGDRPAALAALLRDWSLDECRAWLEHDIGLELVEETGSNKLFPKTNKAATVRDALVAAAERAGAVIVPNTRVIGVERGASGGWTVHREGALPLAAAAVVLAAGGLSAPRLGTTGDGLDIARTLGHTLDVTHPALTPLLGPHPGGAALAGVAVTGATLTVHPPRGKPRRASPRGALLLTHRGYSGPAALDASAWIAAAAAKGGAAPRLTVNWTSTPAADWTAAFDAARRGKGQKSPLLSTVLTRGGFPARLAAALVAAAGVADTTRAADARAKDVAAVVEAATAFELPITGTAGYAPAEVTAGGVRLADVRLPSCESRAAPGVFICGELLAPCGRLGGFNFYWAWVSGRAAGRAAAAAAGSAG